MAKDRKKVLLCDKLSSVVNPKEINEELLYDLAKIHCTMDEIGAVLKCSHDFLEQRYSALIKKAREEGKSSLRRKQWVLADQGNLQMQIWLGKQWLNQRDRKPDEAPQTHFHVNMKDVPK